MTAESGDLHATVKVPFDRAVDLVSEAAILKLQDRGLSVTACPISPGAEARLHKRVDILNGGFITPIGYMGNDLEISRSARVTMGVDPEPDRSEAKERQFIRYLIRKRHTSPFEMAEVKFACCMPIFVARQWIRHRTANVNEMSLRYRKPPDKTYRPDPQVITRRPDKIKQGRSDEILSPEATARVLRIMDETSENQFEAYREMAEVLELAPELARSVLPVSLYTQWVWKIDAHNLMHFLGLRLDAHAQYEIRVYAQAMADFVADWLPWTWAAFKDCVLDSMTLTGAEMRALAAGMRATGSLDQNLVEAAEKRFGSEVSSSDELAEFKAKLERLR